MKKSTAFLLLIFLTMSTFAQKKEYYFSFTEKDKNVINTTLTRIISIDKLEGSTVYAYANPKEFDKFKKLGYAITELPHPSSLSKVTMATTVAQMASWNRYPTYEVYRKMMKNFETNYPTLCKLDSIGTTPDGRKLYVLHISDNVNTEEDEPEFFYSSTMHGDEATGFVLMLRLADYLLSNYNIDTRLTNIVNSISMYICPAANPDGTYNTPSNLDGATRGNSNGVDINRNFPDAVDGQHPDGEAWQPETQAMMNFATNHHITLGANFHGGIEVVNYPWDDWTSSQSLHADNDWYYTISRSYADIVHANAVAGYMTALNNGITEGGDWYVVYGGRQDYMNYFQHSREVTIEISDTKLIPAEQLPNHWNYNRLSFLDYIERTLYGFRGLVTNPSGQPVNATIFISGHDIDNSEIFTDPTVGDYHRMIQPGTYSVTYSAEGYISQTLSVTVANYTSTTIQNVTLQPAQQVTLTGTISAVEGGTPIEWAKVELLNTSFNPVFTNASGQYSIPQVYENTYQIKVSKAGYTGIVQTINVNLSNTNFDFALNISQAESFESGIPAGFTPSGTAWVIDNTEAYDGSASLKSGSIGNSASSTVSIQLNITSAGNITFWKKVSSEASYDKLKFYIDNVEKGSWDGEVAWSEATYAVTTGSHTFKWTYSKDGSSTGGSDCAWIDNITFPAFGVAVTFHVTSQSALIEGASVIFNNQTLTTQSNGNVVFNNVPKGMGKTWSVEKTGYVAQAGTVDVLYQNFTKNVELVSSTNTYTVTFVITDGVNNLANAVVSLDGIAHMEGNYVFAGIVPGDHNYEITCTGFLPALGNINVSNQNVNTTVQLSPIPSYSVTFNLDITPLADFNPASDHLYVRGNFNDWAVPGSAEFELQPSGSNIYSVVCTSMLNSLLYKFYRNNLDGVEYTGDPRTAEITTDTSLNLVWGTPDAIRPVSNIRFTLYPNPANSMITLKSEATIYKITIVNTLGQVIQVIKPSLSENVEINVSEWADGIYQLRIETLKGSQVQRFVKN